MNGLRKNYPCYIILGIYLLCILIADPRGEFPLNDDWSYSRSAFSFGMGQGLKVDQWSAPSLLGQALYGGVLVRLFSPSFLVLRISTLILSLGIVWLLWAVLMRLDARRGVACVALLGWISNPLQFNLSFTYMTEIPFLFFIALAFFLYLGHLKSGKLSSLLWCSAVLGYAYLIRQTALFFILAMVFSLLIDSRRSLRMRLRLILSAAATAAVFIAGYYSWSMHQGSTAAVERKFELLEHLTARQIAGNSYGMLFYLAFMLVPVWIFLLPSVRRLARTADRKLIGIFIAWGLIVGAGLFWFRAQYKPSEYLPSTAYHARMPLLLNVLWDTGLGPLTLEPDYYGAPSTPTYPRMWQGITGVTALGSIVLGTIGLLSIFRFRELLRRRRKQGLMMAFAGGALVSLASFEVVFSHLQEGGLFDRHILIAAFPLCIVLGIWAGEDNDPGRSAWRFLFPGIAATAMMVFSIAATHDYLQWNRIRWDMGRALLSQGIDSLAVVGGFEFNAWHNYDTFARRGNIGRIHYWWYDRRDYVISMSPQEEYDICRSEQYFSWVHRRSVTLYILRRAS